MKHSANYSIVRKSFVNSCDNELRGINATCKVIFAYSGKFADVFNEDGVDANIFASSANVVDLFREKLPQIFNKDGAICSFKFILDNDDNAEVIKAYKETYEHETIPATPTMGQRVRFKIPRTKWTTNQLYGLVVKACKPVKVSQVEALNKEIEDLKRQLEKANESKKGSKK